MYRQSVRKYRMKTGYGNMWIKLKKVWAYLTIMVLLPYIITVFIHGPSFTSPSNVDNTYIKVKTKNGSLEMPMRRYFVLDFGKKNTATRGGSVESTGDPRADEMCI